MLPQRLVGALFLGIGLVILAVGTMVEMSGSSWRSTAQPTTGVVIRLVENTQGQVAPVLRYQVDGQDHEFQGRIYSRPPAFVIGEQAPMLYQPGDPDDAAVDTFLSRHFAGLITGGVGTGFVVPGLLVLLLSGQGARRRRWLQDHGALVQAAITAIRLDDGSGNPRWRIHAQSVGPDGVGVYHSDTIPFDPTPFMGTRRTVEVRVDPERPARYAMDLSWLPRRRG